MSSVGCKLQSAHGAIGPCKETVVTDRATGTHVFERLESSSLSLRATTTDCTRTECHSTDIMSSRYPFAVAEYSRAHRLAPFVQFLDALHDASLPTDTGES